MKGWRSNYVLRCREGIEWQLIRNLVEMWLATGLEENDEKCANLVTEKV